MEKSRVLLGATSSFFIEVSVYVGQFFLSYEMYGEGKRVYETLYRVIRLADGKTHMASKSELLMLSPLERVDVVLQYGQCIEREKMYVEACEIYTEARDMMAGMMERKKKAGWRDKGEEKDWHMKEEEVREHFIFAKRMRDL
ncbi:hypothetical protein EON65_47910 [archaeon]|nr:MAG: hypothetical protein EON65_47910 [archaeon]